MPAEARSPAIPIHNQHDFRRRAHRKCTMGVESVVRT